MKYIERLVPTHDRFEIAHLLLKELSKDNKTVLDLGAGHCQFSISASEFGMQVTAMDARTVRVPKLPDGVRFVEGNFLEAEPPGDFDLILMLGIFYHLTVAEQHVLMKKYMGKKILLDTHFCLDKTAKELVDGYNGIFYKEGPNMDKMLKNPKASFTCLRSFWHSESSLKRFLSEYFSEVTKILPEHYPQRTFFICKP